MTRSGVQYIATLLSAKNICVRYVSASMKTPRSRTSDSGIGFSVIFFMFCRKVSVLRMPIGVGPMSAGTLNFFPEIRRLFHLRICSVQLFPVHPPFLLFLRPSCCHERLHFCPALGGNRNFRFRKGLLHLHPFPTEGA